MTNLDRTFTALLREATFTKEVLGAGATQIRTANYAHQGIYAQAFAGLSVGLERIGKLCLMLDHYIEYNGRFPDFNYLKNSIGHKLKLLQTRASEIAHQRKVKFHFLAELNHPLHFAILQILHAYADGDRYSNINILIGAKQQDDPIAAWFTHVDSYIFENLITQKRKEQIIKNASTLQRAIGPAAVFHTAETGEQISNIAEASFRTGMYEAIAPHRQFFVLQIIRYWVEPLCELGDKAQALDSQEIPFFSEIFCGFYNSDQYLKSRKTWIF
ncbi:hypothetical protein [Azotobacter vinelandii]|uniref:hypothetical protein n=1 Tax=Azotobacter vinelandii TaxID=354 RepID=UPI002666A982|nr:hypothetical protein [Azotobacter vinelandii]WKN21478.1 hypothetical protein AVAEIV_004575 [Azotobacter vinelandii]